MIRARGLLLLSCLWGCSPDAPQLDRVDQELPRLGRFGSLRDLVLFERADAAGGPYFLDRFEVTRDDWQAFVESRGAPPAVLAGPGALPATGMNLAEARAFAIWRFCRLPRSDEWEYAARQGNRFPWGESPDQERANTAELGLGALTLVGTFESGRRVNGPYDLIGNASEWTESVPVEWLSSQSLIWRSLPHREPSPTPDLAIARWQVLRSPALSAWLPSGGTIPWPWLVESLDGRLKREVVGGNCFTRMDDVVGQQLPTDTSPWLGLRLCADPVGLCTSLAAFTGKPTELEAAVLRRLLRRERHVEVLAPAWRRVQQQLRARGTSPGPLGAILDAELSR